MRTTEPQDQGTAFGTWNDPVSRFIYREAPRLWIEALGIDPTRPTVDLGGGNGLLREYFTDLTTVDSDPTKDPDKVADVTLWLPPVGQEQPQAVARFLLHYLSDARVRLLLETVAVYAERFYLIQFVNDDLPAKYGNSRHEGLRYFRTGADLDRLVESSPWSVGSRWEHEYRVTPDFYENRLGPGLYQPHDERMVALALHRPPRPDVPATIYRRTSS